MARHRNFSVTASEVQVHAQKVDAVSAGLARATTQAEQAGLPDAAFGDLLHGMGQLMTDWTHNWSSVAADAAEHLRELRARLALAGARYDHVDAADAAALLNVYRDSGRR